MAIQEVDTSVCPCGIALDDHYTNQVVRMFVDKQVKEHGWTVSTVDADSDTIYYVPRHYIALHGIRSNELAELAEKYGWEMA